MTPFLRPALAALMLRLAGPAGAEGFRLLMIESEGCACCRVSDRDIAPIHAVSPEGRAAPLVHVNLRGPMPAGVTLASRPVVTPTFILIGPDGVEAGRMIGYPGEDFFWANLERMFEKAGVPVAPPGGASSPVCRWS